jgi:hypothetical protein
VFIKNFIEEYKGLLVAVMAFIVMTIFATLVIKFFSSREQVASIYKSNTKEVIAEIVKRGVIDCFDQGDQVEYCGPSAVSYNRDYLLIGSDRKISGETRSALMKFSFNNDLQIDQSTREYVTTDPLNYIEKIEAMSVDRSRRLTLIATSFDREKKDDWDQFNSLILLNSSTPDKITYVGESVRDGRRGSLKFKEQIRSVLKTKEYPQGLPYFKIEALAFIPGDKLLFGIREIGSTYKAFNYAHLIVEAEYIIMNGVMTLSNFKLVADFSLRAREIVGRTVGLSSMEYDFTNDRLYLISSFEEEGKRDEGYGGYLWYTSLNDLNANNMPTQMKDEFDTPIIFAGKAEGLTVIDEETILVVHDDDKELGRSSEEMTNPSIQFSRKANHGLYTVVKVRPKPIEEKKP